MKNDVKIEEELTCQFKIDMGNWANFDRSTQKSQNFHFNGLPLTKLYNVRNLGNIWEMFTRALKSLKIGTLMGFFYPKLKMYELKLYRGFACHGNENWGSN